jgi:hypothetical protein
VSFRIYRILGSTSRDLEPERQLFESTLTAFGEEFTFPQQVLFAGASFRPPFDSDVHRTSGEENVRMCDFFLHIFSDKWPGAGFQAFIDLARASMADSSKPMRAIAVLFKNFPDADEKVRNYRAALAANGNCELRDFEDAAGLERQLREVFTSWWESVQARP